jgi:penicillin-binding protein 1C
VVSDRNGELLGARIADDEQWRFPALDTLPTKYSTCVIAFEDRSFRYHWGVNPLAIGRAIVQNIKEKRIVSGGSTISMQVIRLSRKNKRHIWEKAVESILATRLEFRYSKNKILALYASHAPFGGNVVGLEAAAWRYFGHSPDELSWAEAATLAVLPNAPAKIHISKNQQKLLEKRNRLLKYLYENQKINATDYELALDENLPSQIQPLPQIAPHLVSRFYVEKRGENCRTTIDKSLQIRVENLLQHWNNELILSDIRNIAAVVIDVANNEIVAYCGNVNYQSANNGNQVDCAIAERSTGSILKPFLYCAMLQEGEILPKTLQPDIPLSINGYAPKNFNLQYEGAVHADEAVARSLNVPLVAMLRKYSVPKFYNFLKTNKIAQLPHSSDYYGLSLILGGAEAKLLDVTNAYANMARTLLGNESAACRFLLNEKQKTVATTFNAAAVWNVFEAIKEVKRPDEIDWRDITTMQRLAWKTGTSFGFRDAWAVGVTPRYAVGVWVGNANGEGKPNLVGARTAGPIMFDIFNILPTAAWFQMPENQFVETEICHKSGHLKGRFCPLIDTVLVLPAALQSEVCPYHISINLTPDGRYRVAADCLDSGEAVETSWFVLPPAWALYYMKQHIDYRPIPQFIAGCDKNENQMQFVYPVESNSIVRLPRQLDGSQGEITFELAHVRASSTVFWHIDGDFSGTTSDFHKFTVFLVEGKHSIVVVDDAGNALSCVVNVVK